MRLRLPLALLVACLLPALPRAQGETGFLRGKGKLDIVLTYDDDDFEESLASPVGGPIFVIDTERNALSLYAAYGLNDDIDLIGQATLAGSKFNDIPGSPEEMELQDAIVAAKWRVKSWRVGQGNLDFLLFPGMKFPINNYQTNGFIALGAGQTDYRFRFITHYKPDHGRWYASVDAGYDRRTKDPADELVSNLKLGHAVGPVMLSPFVSYIKSRDPEDDPGGAFGSVGSDFLRYGVEAYLPLGDSFGLVTRYRVSDDDRPTGDIPGWSVGVIYRR